MLILSCPWVHLALGSSLSCWSTVLLFAKVLIGLATPIEVKTSKFDEEVYLGVLKTSFHHVINTKDVSGSHTPDI